MKQRALLTLVLVAAGAASAASPGEDEYNEQNRGGFTSSITRAEVQAQLAEAVRSGDVDRSGEANPSYAVNQQAGSQRDRGAVREEAVLAARSSKVQELM
jgi:Domain of unknown function (DUF4148)